MKTKHFYLCLLLLVLGTANVWADKYYRPKERVSTLETGKKYMIYNTCRVGNADWTGFLYNNGSSLSYNRTKKSSDHIYDECHVFELSSATDEMVDYDFYLKSLSSQTYVNISGGSSETGVLLYIPQWKAGRDAGLNSLAGNDIWSESEDETTWEHNSGTITADDKVFFVANEGKGTYWSGKWSGTVFQFYSNTSGQPLAFYEVEEVTAAAEPVVQDLHMFSRCDIYSAQKIYGYVQDVSQFTWNKPYIERPASNLLDGSYDTYYVTNWTNSGGDVDHYVQIDLDVRVSDLRIYMKRRANNYNVPAKLNIWVSNTPDDEASWKVVATELPTNMGSKIDFMSEILDFTQIENGDGSYRHVRIAVPERTGDTSQSGNRCFSLSELYVLPGTGYNGDVITNSLNYFDNTLPISNTVAGYQTILASYDNSVKLLSGVPMAGYKYRIYADAYSGSSWTNRDISTNDNGDLLANAAYDKNNNAFVWECIDAGDGKLAFKNEETGKYLQNGTVGDDLFAWTIKTDETYRHGVPLIAADGGYLAAANSGDGFAAAGAITNALNQTAGDYCTDFVFLPIPLEEGEKQITITNPAYDTYMYTKYGSLKVGETAINSESYVAIYNEESALPAASVVDGFALYEFRGFFCEDTDLGTTLEYSELTDGMQIEARFGIKVPFEYTAADAAEPTFYTIRNVRAAAEEQTGYAKYDGRTTQMKQTADVTAENLFYFTGEADGDAYVAKIHNAATLLICDNINSWTSAGRDYYVQPNNRDTEGCDGYAISLTRITADATNPQDAWADHGGTGTVIGNDQINDDGATWVFEKVAPETAKSLIDAYINEQKAAVISKLQALKDNDSYSDEVIDAKIEDINSTPSTLAQSLALAQELESAFVVTAAEACTFPTLTTDENAPVWYYVKNIRDTGKPYAKFMGDALEMLEVAAPTSGTLFYFTGEESVTTDGCKALKVKINNFATTNKMAAIDSWNAEGTDYYIYLRATDDNPGFIISTAADNATHGWSDYGGTSSDAIKDYEPGDDGSTWQFEQVTDFRAPLADYIATIKTAEAAELEEQKESSDDYYDGIIDGYKTYVDGMSSFAITYAEMLAFANEIRAVSEIASNNVLQLPRLSTDTEKHYYRIENTKSATKFIGYEGDAAAMSLSTDERAKQLFYFTGEKTTCVNGMPALKVMMNNVVTSNKLANGATTYFENLSLTGAGVANAAINGTEALASNASWILAFDVARTNQNSYNAYGSAVLSTAADALYSDFTNGFQVYLGSDGNVIFRMGESRTTFEPAVSDNTEYKFRIAYSPKSIVVSVTFIKGAHSEVITKTITQFTLADIQALYTAIPVGMNISNMRAYGNAAALSWAADGNYWYITHSENSENPGLSIVSGDADPENEALNNAGGSGTSVALWTGNDGGSHWSFTEVTDFTAYEVNERNAEKAAFNAAVAAKPALYAPARVSNINGMYDALDVTGSDMASLQEVLERLPEIRAEWDVEQDALPTLTADENAPAWYAIKNVRSGKYANYTGDDSEMSQVAVPVNTSLFYFTGESAAGPLKIHNMATANLAAAHNKWTAEGTNYYFVEYNHETNPGYVVTNVAGIEHSEWSAWNDKSSSNVTNYSCKDAGSTWMFEKIENFEVVYNLNKRVTETLEALDAVENNPSAFFVVDNSDHTALRANIEALRSTYADGTYANCSIADAALKTYSEAVDALYKQSAIFYFKSALGDYWITTNSQQVVATTVETVHTNVWKLEYAGLGKYYIYNEAGNKYVARCVKSSGNTPQMNADKQSAGMYVFVPQADGKYLIKSADCEGAYLRINVGNVSTVTTTTDTTIDAAKWELTRQVEKIIISDELYAATASLVWTEMAKLNSEFGLVRFADMITCNYPAVDANGDPNDGGGYPALIDSDAATYFHSAYDATHGNPVSGIDHYLQVDLGENNGVSSLYMYMRARNQNNRPTKITVEASNDNSEWTPIGNQLTTDLGHQLMFLSGLIGDETEGAPTYRYWRFTVNETNTRTQFFALSEFMLFKNVDYIKNFFTGANNFYNTHFELLDIVKGAIKYANADVEYYIERNEGGVDIDNTYKNQEIGHYLTEKYDKLVEAYETCNNLVNSDTQDSDALEAAWKALDGALAEYLDSRNCPVYYVRNAYEDGYSGNVAVCYTGKEFDTGELSKWDYTQLFYAEHLMSENFELNPDGTVAVSPFERSLISYNGRKPFYNSYIVDFTAMSDWRSVNGYAGDAKTAYNIDVNTSSNGDDYLNVGSVGLFLGVIDNKSEIDAESGKYTNRPAAWYVDYVCQKKNLDKVGVESLQYLDALYRAYNMLTVRIERTGDDFNQYKWVGTDGQKSDMNADMEIAKSILSSTMKELADALHESVTIGGVTITNDYIDEKAEKLGGYLECFELNMPTAGRYYRFAGMTNRGVAQDYYITSEAVQHVTGGAGNQYTISMKPLYTDEATYAQNEETTIYYFGAFEGLTYNPGWLTDDAPKTYLMAYKTGRYIGLSSEGATTKSEYNNWVGKRNNWNFEAIHLPKEDIVPSNFSKSVTAYASPAYAIKTGTHFLYAGNDYVDRSIDPRQAAAGNYWKHDWAIELVEELPVTFSELRMSSFYVPVELQIPEGVKAYILFREKVSESHDLNVATDQAHSAGYDVFELMEIRGGILPAETAVILKADEAKTYHFKINYEPTITTEKAKRETYTYEPGFENIENLLLGTHETDFIEEIDGKTHYVLANKSNGVGMYKMNMKTLTSYTSYKYTQRYDGVFANKVFLNSAHRAYLPFPTPAGSGATGYLFSVSKNHDGSTTAIESVVNAEETGKFNAPVYDIQGRRVEKITDPGIYVVDGKTILVQ